MVRDFVLGWKGGGGSILRRKSSLRGRADTGIRMRWAVEWLLIDCVGVVLQGTDLDALVLQYIADYITLDPKPISVNPLVVSGTNLVPTQLTKDKVTRVPRLWAFVPALIHQANNTDLSPAVAAVTPRIAAVRGLRANWSHLRRRHR